MNDGMKGPHVAGTVSHSGLPPLLSVIAILAWTAILALLYAVEYRQIVNKVSASAYIEAQTNVQKDLTFRRWATRHGGVYVPPTELTPPNPYLAHIPDRDLVSGSGKRLTLMNPAYIMRQVTSDYGQTYGVLGKLTSSRLINPVNAPDNWEADALRRFDAGETEVTSTFTDSAGIAYLRVMRAIYTETGCMKCHGHQGYSVGDVRGGLSISVPLDQHARLHFATMRLLGYGFLLLWAVGCLLLLFGIRRMRRDLTVLLAAQTEQALLAEQMNHSYKLASVGELAAEVAHEFNNILSIISTHSQLGGLSSNPDRIADCFTTITAQVKRGTELVTSINGIVRKRGQELEPLILPELIDEIVRLETRALAKAGISIERRYDPATPPVPGLRGELQQVVINLLHNARDAMQTRGGTITISLAPSPHGVELRFADTGQGIAAGVLPHIFDPFYSTKAKDGRGTGLGLSLSRKIIERHGGSIRAENLPGSGAVFVIHLPATVRHRHP